jgi:putative SOS response-associated peptidase YedK
MAENKERKLVQMRWGFMPMWEKEPEKARPIFNARQDKVATSTFFKGSLANKRCLIPATGFYEWVKEGPRKGPKLFKLNKGELFAFSGLWKTWKPPEGDIWYTSTIITTEPNKLVGKVHNRMPVILHQKEEEKWLDDSITDLGYLASLLKPFPAEQMEIEEAVIPSSGAKPRKPSSRKK